MRSYLINKNRWFYYYFRDNFHNHILRIDKRLAFGIVGSTILTNFSLSKGGDGWRSAFNLSNRSFILLRYSFDERIEEGLYGAPALEIMKRMIEDPASFK